MSKESDTSYIKEPQWGNMLRAWEEQKLTHHKLCHVQTGWDMSCDCKKIKEVEDNFFMELPKDIENTEINIMLNTVLNLIPVVEQMWGYDVGDRLFALRPNLSGNVLLRTEVKDVLIEYMRVELLKEIEGNKAND